MIHGHHFREKGGFEVNIGMKLEGIEDPFTEVPPAKEMYLFLRQGMKPEVEPLVKPGETVKFGQKIGDDTECGPMAVPIHSPVNGKVKEIKKMTHPLSGKEEDAIIIETTDNKQDPPLKGLNPESATREELLERIREAGIVGLGGASFPTHVKLSTKNKISHLLINAKESDPNIACDYRLMRESPDEIIEGIQIIAKILNTDNIIFATRTQEGETPEFEGALQKSGISISHIHPNYSIGSERLLVKEILGKELPAKKYPPDIGVIVHNISTAQAVCRAVKKGMPLISRGLTMYSSKTGGKNLWVRMGTPVSHILKFIGASPEQFNRIALGSIMMGVTIKHPFTPVLKATSGITAFTEQDPNPYADTLPCIRCGYCNTVCPVDIYPQLIMEAEKRKDKRRLKKLHVEICIECGLCSYVCPSLIKLTEFLVRGKKLIREN